MKRQTLFLSIVTAAIFALPAFAANDGITGIQWGRNSKDFDAMPSGPQPLKNLNRDERGVADDHELVGDYRNPILTPYAAAIVKEKGELAIKGGYPTPKEQCRPLAPPFSAAIQFDFQILQKKNGDLAIVYHADNQVRHIRMNGKHPQKLVPSAMGDSIGHWEGDMLVIDTVGVKGDAFTMIDRFGVPLTEAMHIVERYRQIDGARAKADLAKYEESEGVVGGRVNGYNPDTKLTGLRLEVTMEDPKIFTAPLTGVVTYRRLTFGWREDVCADNPVEHYKDEWIGLPTSNHPDF
jgi:hypothetical protein